jgi:hypothetical protein
VSMSIERGKRGMGRRSLRHCLGLSPSSPDPGGETKYTPLHTLSLRMTVLVSTGPL